MSVESSDTVSKGRLAARMKRIKPASTLAVAARTAQMRREGKDVVSFSTGEPDFDTPEVISRAGIEAITSGFTHYTDASGIVELREAVAQKFSLENGIPATAKNVLVSAGGKHSFFNAMMAILDPGDEVIIPAPYWISYPEMVTLLGGTPVPIRTTAQERYKITADRLRAAMTPKTKAIIINSPSNPTGVMYTPDELREFAEIAAEADVFLISDELYEKIVYGDVPHFSIGSIPELHSRAITINGVSKAYAMTGWRIGYMTGPEDVIAAAAAAQSQTTSNPSSISQKAALVALKEGEPDVIRMREEFRKRRELMGSLLREIPDITFPEPDGAFYYFIDVGSYLAGPVDTCDKLAEYLLTEHLTAFVAGSAFGDEKGIRLSYACSETDIRKGMERIAEGLAKLRR